VGEKPARSPGAGPELKELSPSAIYESIDGFPTLTAQFPWVAWPRVLGVMFFAVTLLFLAQDGNMETGNNRYLMSEGWSFYG